MKLLLNLFVGGFIFLCLYVLADAGLRHRYAQDIEKKLQQDSIKPSKQEVNLPQPAAPMPWDEYLDAGNPPWKEINYNLFNVHSLFLRGKFDPGTALHRLFRGNFFKFPSGAASWASYTGDSISFVSWRCDNCPRTGFMYYFGDMEPVQFPLEVNETVLTGVDTFRNDEGRECVMLSTSTGAGDTWEDHSGRFTGGFLGAALFSKINTGWKLEAFSPAIGYYGAWQHCDAPARMQFGYNNYGCVERSTNGGAGSVYNTQLALCGVINGRFRVLLEDDFISRSNAPGGEWDSEVKPVEGNKTFNDVQVITRGTLLYEGLDDWEWNTLPDVMADEAMRQHGYYFILTRTFSYSKGKYTLSNSKLQTIAPLGKYKNLSRVQVKFYSFFGWGSPFDTFFCYTI